MYLHLACTYCTYLPTQPDPPLYAETIDGDIYIYDNKVATSFFLVFLFCLSKYRQFSSSLPILPFFFSLFAFRVVL